MSRHRDVRCMNYSDEYDGYDDVYGHSVEDDYCVSPSVEQFLFDRSKQQNIASFITEPDIIEDNEDVDDNTIPSTHAKTELSQFEMAKLMSCIESIRNVIGDSISESLLKEEIIKSGFDTEIALNALLKESVNETSKKSAIDKDHADTYPDASTKHSDTPTFAIPKLTFQKRREVQEESTMPMSFLNNFESLKKLTNNNPPRYSSLMDTIAGHSKTMSISTSKASSSNNENSSSFASLADLTSHHLQKTNDSSNNTISSAFTSLADLTAHHLQSTNNLMNTVDSPMKLNSVNTNFVIPKLSLQRNRQLPTHNTSLDNLKEKKPNVEQDDFINSIEKKLSAVRILPASDDTKNFDYSCKNSENIPAMRTPSPDNWIIDLSTALKEAESLDSSDLIKENYMQITNLQCDLTFELNSLNGTSQSFSTYPPVDINCIFNLKSLSKAKLPYAAKRGSSFGTVLCRKWRIKKTPIKRQLEQYNTVVRFDFSTPYSRK